MFTWFRRFFSRQVRLDDSRPFNKIKSFQIYYDFVNPQVLTALKNVDLAIIEPHYYDNRQVKELQLAETIVIGYLALIETPTWNTARIQYLQPRHYLLINNKPLHFPKWDSYLMDLRQSQYQEILMQEIEFQIIEKGMDGILLDTIGGIEEYVPPEIQEDMRNAYVEFLQRITRKFPHLFLIQNRGFDTLNLAFPYLHGFLWEDWNGTLINHPWVNTRIQLLTKYQRADLKVFTVTTSNERTHADTSKKLSFVHLSCPNGYNDL